MGLWDWLWIGQSWNYCSDVLPDNKPVESTLINQKPPQRKYFLPHTTIISCSEMTRICNWYSQPFNDEHNVVWASFSNDWLEKHERIKTKHTVQCMHRPNTIYDWCDQEINHSPKTHYQLSTLPSNHLGLLWYSQN